MRTFGLIGFPLSHSFSKKYFEEKFLRDKIEDVQFINFELEKIETLPHLIQSQPSLAGFSVTIPHKVSILPFLTEISDEAKEIGSVNCVKVMGNGRLCGFNTDAMGFEKSIRPFLENKFERALILGTGGGSKAVAHVFRKLGIDFRFVSRNPLSKHEIGYDDLNSNSISHFRLIVNTTPLGTYPNVHACPALPFDHLTSHHFVFDLVYNPAETELLKRSRKQGCTTMNGLEMLHHQADASWRIWNTSSS
ncbi:MAG: shikimate dehydrogenase [Flavobacteriales bacterium]|nr:shikimate dehydrogenase [Flavobacteriales bacterium]